MLLTIVRRNSPSWEHRLAVRSQRFCSFSTMSGKTRSATTTLTATMRMLSCLRRSGFERQTRRIKGSGTPTRRGEGQAYLLRECHHPQSYRARVGSLLSQGLIDLMEGVGCAAVLEGRDTRLPQQFEAWPLLERTKSRREVDTWRKVLSRTRAIFTRKGALASDTAAGQRSRMIDRATR